MGDKGMKYLFIALDLYKQWGAMTMDKAADLEQFIKIKDITKIKRYLDKITLSTELYSHLLK